MRDCQVFGACIFVVARLPKSDKRWWFYLDWWWKAWDLCATHCDQILMKKTLTYDLSLFDRVTLPRYGRLNSLERWVHSMNCPNLVVTCVPIFKVFLTNVCFVDKREPNDCVVFRRCDDSWQPTQIESTRTKCVITNDYKIPLCLYGQFSPIRGSG